MKNVVESKSKHNRLSNAFNHPWLNELLRFLGTALPTLIQLNLLLQKVDPLIHILYDVLFPCTCLLWSRFSKPKLVQQYKKGELSCEEIKVQITDVDNILENDWLFGGFLVWGQVNALSSDGTITQRQVRNVYSACLEFHQTAFLYAIYNFPIEDEFLKHVRFLNFYNQKRTFESV